MLIVFSGLPGSGKTTIARELARQLRATYLRIDTIEQTLRSTLVLGNGVSSAGYVVAYSVSEANLALGQTVIADCVNPVAATRDAWRDVAAKARSPLFNVEIICSDAVQHRRRVENRTTDIPGLKLPTWSDVIGRDYEPWTTSRMVLDTAKMTTPGAVSAIRSAVEQASD